MASRRRTKTSGGARKSGGGGSVSRGGGVRGAAQARVSLGPAGEGLDPADRRDKLEVFLQDFDREVLARKQQIQTLTSSMLEGLNMCYSLRISSLPARVRAMSLQEYKAMSLGNEQLEPPLEELLEADMVLDKAMRLRGKRVGGVKLEKQVTVQGSNRGATAGEETEKLTAQEGSSLRNRGSSRKNGLHLERVREAFGQMVYGWIRLARTPHMFRTRAGSKLPRDSIRLSGTTMDNVEGETSVS
ncbi:unnamed protein product [Lampetra fluviatilis]